MGVLQAFRLCLQLPKKSIVFQLNRVKTRDFFLYIVGLHLLIAGPNGIRMVADSVNRGAFVSESLLIFLLYPTFTIMFGIASISGLASLGYIIKIIVKRKLAYQLLWKMTVYALTHSVILYSLFDLLGIMNWKVNLFLFILFLFIFLNMILTYPKMKEKRID